MIRAARAGLMVRLLPAAFLLLAAAWPALAQTAGEISVGIATVFPSPYPADWQQTHSLANMFVSNSAQTPVTADLTTSILRDGAVVAATPPVPRVYPVGGSTFPTYSITTWAAMGFQGKIRDVVEETGRLPDGVYTLCMNVDNAQTTAGEPIPPASACANFVVFYPKPPALVQPENGSVVSVPLPVFQWTPVLSQGGRQTPHWFRLVEVLPNQTPLQAIEANRSIYEAYVTYASSLPYPASAPLLIEGRRYAWRVQALFPIVSSRPPISTHASFQTTQATEIRPIGENEGRSKVFTFTWTADPRRAIELQREAAGFGGANERRLGMLGEEPETDAESVEEGAAARSPESGSRESFADRLVRVMASMWRRGPGAAAAAARDASMPRRAYEAPAPASRQSSDPRIAQGPSGTDPATETAAAESPDIGMPESPAADSLTAGAPMPSEAEPGVEVISTEPSPAEAAPPTMEPATGVPAAPSGVGPGWARLHGTASISGEAYSRSGSGAETRPYRSGRVVTGLSIGVLGDRLRIPVSALVSDDQVSFRQNINQVAVAPRWQWAGLTAGNFSPQFSSYTLADASLLGGGLDLAPKQWRLGFVTGRSREAVAPTTSALVTAQFERNVTAGRLGYGNPMGNSIDVTVMRAADDEGSLGPDAGTTLLVTPEANTVYSVRAQGVLPKRHLRAQIETALSRYERDRRADAPDVDGRAVALQLFHETALSRVGVKAEYLDGGFMTLGNSGITGDRVDLGIQARVQMLQGKLTLDGTAGLRNDAVSTSITAETRRRNYGLVGSWQPGMRFGTDVQMAIYTNESDATDSLLLGTSSTTRLYSVSPRTAWSIGGIQNSLSCSATLQESENGSAGTSTFLSTESLTLLANWSAMISAPWTVTFGGNYTKTDFQVAVSEISSFGPGFLWSAFRSKLVTSAQLQLTRSRTGNTGSDTELIPRMEMRYEIAPRQALVLRGNYRRYQYANPASPEFNERTATLEYVTNL